MHTAREPIAGRASPSWRAARRVWNTSGPARWRQARPTVWFMGSFLARTAVLRFRYSLEARTYLR
ncbi:MAG: hypothetical protein FJ398_16695 [Verrucomicrobia bacterium]|nr:hypothetical protein [Verrucomicrobiota bacterium]